VEKASEYLPALREALACNETTVLDVITDPAAYPPVTFFDGLDDIRMSKAEK
jgi:acetolactate synthase-1/2/3 large subunit